MVSKLLACIACTSMIPFLQKLYFVVMPCEHDWQQVVASEAFTSEVYGHRFSGDIKSAEGSQLVDEYHIKYINALQTLWHSNKDKYAKKRLSELQIVE